MKWLPAQVMKHHHLVILAPAATSTEDNTLPMSIRSFQPFRSLVDPRVTLPFPSMARSADLHGRCGRHCRRIVHPDDV